MKKKFTEETLRCPFCEKEFLYNVASIKAKVECPHCKTDLIVRNRQSIFTGFLAIPLFVVIKTIFEVIGISQFGAIVELPALLFVGLIFVFFFTKLITKIKGPERVFAVDCEDPTVLERKKKENKP